jgi:hypothetical protein
MYSNKLYNGVINTSELASLLPTWHGEFQIVIQTFTLGELLNKPIQSKIIAVLFL